MARRRSAQPTFTMLVANLKGGSDPSKGVAGNPVKARTGFTYQHFPTHGDVSTPGLDGKAHAIVETKMGLVNYSNSPVPVGASATILVADNTFTAGTLIYIGDFTLESDEDFTVGGTTALTAVELAAAIDALPGFSAPVPGGSTITVTGPAGPSGNDLTLDAFYTGGVANFTLTPDDGTFGSAEPTIGPPDILP